MARIAATMPIVDQLREHGKEVDSAWWSRTDSSRDRTIWLTTPFSVNPRGDTTRAESNYRVIKADLQQVALDVDYRVDLWPGGQIHTLQVRADDALALRAVQQWVSALESWPVADDADLSDLEHEQIYADWRNSISSIIHHWVSDATAEAVAALADTAEQIWYATMRALDAYPEHDGREILWDMKRMAGPFAHAINSAMRRQPNRSAAGSPWPITAQRG